MIELMADPFRRKLFGHPEIIEGISRLPDVCDERECSTSHLSNVTALVLRMMPLLREGYIELLGDQAHLEWRESTRRDAVIALTKLCSTSGASSVEIWCPLEDCMRELPPVQLKALESIVLLLRGHATKLVLDDEVTTFVVSVPGGACDPKFYSDSDAKNVTNMASLIQESMVDVLVDRLNENSYGTLRAPLVLALKKLCR